MGWALSGDKTKGTTDISTIITYPPTNNYTDFITEMPWHTLVKKYWSLAKEEMI